MFKTIDKLLMRSFLAPFFGTFLIALFVLIMQFLWLYIDDIIGKGVGFFMMIELIGYLSVSLIPTALPIAILISSVMVMGNLAERYELASFKSAGVRLLRVMQPLLYLAVTVAIFSFICSNNLIPVSNLKFKSRLYDIRKSKPTLSMEQGQFNDDFKNFTIHIGHKNADNVTIEDVLIYDHNNYNRGKFTMITAKKGKMYTTPDDQYFVMDLYDGIQYQEAKQSGTGKDKTYPFIRTSFREWTKVFDLGEFDLNHTNEELFKSHQSMLTVSQLKTAIDTIELKIGERESNYRKNFAKYYPYLKTYKDTINQSKDDGALVPNDQKKSKYTDQLADQISEEDKAKAITIANKQVNKKKKAKKELKTVRQILDSSMTKYTTLLHTFEISNQSRFNSKAKSMARNMQGQTETTMRFLDREKEKLVKHIFELNIKFSMALACIIFLFIGAPMGAIIRKGGFGFPLLVSISFFMFYIVLNILAKKLAESFVLNATLAAWVPCFVLFPIGLILTVRAMNDSKIVNLDRYLAIIRFFTRLMGGSA